jgi:Domain of unknown function (DUF1906)
MRQGWTVALIVAVAGIGIGGVAGCSSAAFIDTTEQSLSTALQGVDRAEVFTATEATSLKTAYGAAFTGVYIGGPCSAGSGWTATTVTTIYKATGWSFLPIFVGQQVASICGRDTLTEAQGITDGNDALTIMTAFEWPPGSHIPVALDLEAGTYSGNESGATSYVKGFADTVSAGGYDVYVYSSVTALNALAAADLPITGAWPAYWLSTGGGYKAGLQPSAVPGLAKTWATTAGAWQYNSGTSVVGDIDYDVADFPLAPAPGQTLPLPDMAEPDDLVRLDAPTIHDGGEDLPGEPDLSVADEGNPLDGHDTHGGCAMSGQTPSSAPTSLLILFSVLICRRRRRPQCEWR